MRLPAYLAPVNPSRAVPSQDAVIIVTSQYTALRQSPLGTSATISPIVPLPDDDDDDDDDDVCVRAHVRVQQLVE
jgi:hypothetical protein